MSTSDEAADRPDHINQIREIILGPQRREFEHRFGLLESAVSDFHTEIRKQIEELKAAHTEELCAAVKSLEQQIASVRTAQEDQRNALLQQLDQLGHAFSRGAEEINARVNDAQTKFQQELGALKERVYRDLEERLLDLRVSHVPRSLLADMLFELGVKVKGVDGLPGIEATAETTANGQG